MLCKRLVGEKEVNDIGRNIDFDINPNRLPLKAFVCRGFGPGTKIGRNNTAGTNELVFFPNVSGKLESLGGEFFWADSMDAVLLFSSIPSVSRF